MKKTKNLNVRVSKEFMDVIDDLIKIPYSPFYKMSVADVVRTSISLVAVSFYNSQETELDNKGVIK